MRKYIKLGILLSPFLTFGLMQGASADVPTISGEFYKTHYTEYEIYGLLGTAAIVCVIAAVAIVMLGGVRRSVLAKKNATKIINEKK